MKTEFTRGDIVQFNEKHKWCGCIGFVSEVRHATSGVLMIGVSIPQRGVAYIFAEPDEVEYIGRAVLMPNDTESEE